MRLRAACTGFVKVMTPMAPTRISNAEVAKIKMLGHAY
jgi:hypothetical protein